MSAVGVGVLTAARAAAIMRQMRRDKTYRSTPIGGIAGQYIRWFRNEWGASERSIDDYESVLALLAVDHADLTLADFAPPVGTERVREFIDAHWGSSAAGTRAKVTSILKSFFRWAFDRDLLAGDPMLKIRRPRRRGVERHAHDVDRVRAIISAQDDARDKVAIALMARLGLRKNELRLLRWRDIQLRSGELVVRGKGGTIATIPIVYEDLRLDLEHLALAVEAKPDEYLLYPVHRAHFGNVETPHPDRPMQPSTMHRWWARCLVAASVAHFPMHELRHTAITEFLRATQGNLALAQLFARHASIQTTVDVYGHLSREDLVGGMRKAAGPWNT